MKLKFKRLSGRACAPIMEAAQLGGYDLFLAQEIKLKSQSVQMLKTDIALKFPKDHY